MQQLIQCLEINLSHVSGRPGPLVLHLLPFLRGGLLEPTPQPLVEAVLDHLAVTLQHHLGSKTEKVRDFYHRCKVKLLLQLPFPDNN